MKKVLFLAFAIAICLTGCKKDEEQPKACSYTQNGTIPSIAVALPNNLIEDEYVSANMPQSTILGAFRMTYDEFMAAWTTGAIEFGSSDNCTPPMYEWNNSTVSESWGHWFDVDGNVCASNDSDAAFCIMGVRDADTGTDSPFQYIVRPAAGYEQFTGSTVKCLQAFKYTDGERTETIAVPWTVKIEKGDIRILEIAGGMSLNLDYEDGLNEQKTTVAIVGIEDIVGFDPADSSAVLIVNGKVDMSTKSDKIFVNLDGTAADSASAAAVIYKNADKKWCYRLMPNEVAEGNRLTVNLGFVNETHCTAAGYYLDVVVKERTFAEMNGTFSMTTGIVFQGKMLSTTRQREYTFDLPADVYTTLEYLVAQRGQSGLTLATLISRGFVTVNGPLTSLEESTATPYGHWFDSNAKVCKEGASNAYSCFVLTPNLTTGHCPITLKNVPGANKAGDRKIFQQTLHSTVLGLNIPITYIVTVE